MTIDADRVVAGDATIVSPITMSSRTAVLDDLLERGLGVSGRARHGSSFLFLGRFDSMRFTSASKSLSNSRSWLERNLSYCSSARRLRAVSNYVVSNVDKIPVDGERPVRLCNYSDVYNNEFISLRLDFMPCTATEDETRKFGLLVDDVIITKDSESWDDIGIPALVVETAEDLVCGYHLALLRPHERAADLRTPSPRMRLTMPRHGSHTKADQFPSKPTLPDFPCISEGKARARAPPLVLGHLPYDLAQG